MNRIGASGSVPMPWGEVSGGESIRDPLHAPLTLRLATPPMVYFCTARVCIAVARTLYVRGLLPRPALARALLWSNKALEAGIAAWRWRIGKRRQRARR